jgi:curved DNA-binding protein CbpA
VLEIVAGGATRRLHVREGAVYLPATHPLARQLGERLAAIAREPALGRQPEEPLRGLVERIAEVLVEWRPERWRFDEGLQHLPGDLVGPLPTAGLLMAGAVAGLAPAAVEALLKRGGERWVAAASLTGGDPVGPLPEELFLLERLRLPMTLRELADGSPVPREVLLRTLLGLAAAGAVHVHRSGQPVAPAPAEQRDFVSQISERIGRGLREEPLALEPEAYRTLIADLLSRHGGLDHYELLGIPAGAGNDQVQAAFERLARLAHPSNATRFGSPGSESALAILFERATLAYETLMDPERRRVYNQRELIEMTVAPHAESTQRGQERREIGRDQYQRAQAYASSGDVHNAILMLEQAVQTDPRPAYWTLLGRLQARNPSWRNRAQRSFLQALQLDPRDADAHFASAQFFEQLGERERALSHYQTTVRLDPGHLEAAARLAALGERRTEHGGQGVGLLARWFKRR